MLLIKTGQQYRCGGIFLLIYFFMPAAYAERMLFTDVFQHSKQVEHQLSGVNQILQDTYGFMWFACEKGLARFDGVDTRIYRHDKANPFSLPGDFVRSLLIDHNGTLWAGTDAGVCYYTAESDRFMCRQQLPQWHWPDGEVHALAIDQDNTVYVGTSHGVYYIEADRRYFAKLPLKMPAFDGLVGVPAIAVDSKNVVWIGTFDSGMASYNPRTGERQYFQADETRTNSLALNKIASLAVDKQDRVWVGTYGGGISVLSANRRDFTHFAHHPNDPNSLASNVIWDIFPDRAGDVWLAVDQGGLVRFNDETGFISLRHKPYDSASLGPNQVRAIYEDDQGDLWVGAFPSGINFHNSATRKVQTFKHEPDNPFSLSHSAILDIFRDASGAIWIGTEDGFNHFDPATQRFTRYFSSAQTGLPSKAVLALAQYDKHTLWVGTWSGGLFAFDLRSKTIRPVDTRPAFGNGRSTLFIWDILRDRNGDMWLATEFDGVAFYERKSGKFRYWSHDSLGTTGALPSNFVRDLMEDRNGAIWMATKKGLAMLAPGDTQLSWVERSADPNGLRGERVSALHEDRLGRIWVATQDNGTFVYDPATTHFRAVGAEHDLAQSMSTGFLEDQLGYLWIFTTNGLLKVHEQNFAAEVFGTENGLTSNNFNRSAALRYSDRLVFVGSADGLNAFNPAELAWDSSTFPLRVTGMRIMNEEVQPGAEHSPLKQAIHLTSSVELHHRDSMFAFDFAALAYRHAHDMRYAYLLEGFDDHWNYVGRIRSATYTNIAPGEYRFRVKSSTGKGDWIESSAIRVVINPAPWLRWWAYLGYAAVFFTLSYFAVHYLRLRSHTQVYKTLSSTDVMTGLANRAGLTQAAKPLFEHRRDSILAVIFIDIDYFKHINDTLGHDGGDRVLVEVVDLFRECLRQSDLLGRWGGEEFVLVWSGGERSDAVHVAEKIRQHVAEHAFDQRDSRGSARAPLPVTVSIGIAFVERGESFEAAIKRADLALYRAKDGGRNCIVEAV